MPPLSYFGRAVLCLLMVTTVSSCQRVTGMGVPSPGELTDARWETICLDRLLLDLPNDVELASTATQYQYPYAIDYHTRVSRDGAGLDFDEGDWTRTPAHILLLFRLRETLGLKNPELEHPLFYSCFDTLAPHAQFAPDELLVRVLAQMKRDGFDEDEICASEMP